MQIPSLPLDVKSRHLIDFCLTFLTVEGFLCVYAEKLAQHGKPGAAYEATEQLYCELFSRRRYSDIEVFHIAKARHNRKK